MRTISTDDVAGKKIKILSKLYLTPDFERDDREQGKERAKGLRKVTQFFTTVDGMTVEV